MSNKNKYYVVLVGRHPGIYDKWIDCYNEVAGYSNAVFKKFDTLEMAVKYAKGHSEHKKPTVITRRISKAELDAADTSKFIINGWSDWTVIDLNGTKCKSRQNYVDNEDVPF